MDYARPGGQEEEDGDDEAEMPLLGDVSVHNPPGLVSVELSPRGKARDVEAGGGEGCGVDGPVSSR